jgi:hypothetical protein
MPTSSPWALITSNRYRSAAECAFLETADRRAPDIGRDVIVRLGKLRFDGEEIPRTLENVFHLELENIRIGIDVAMHPEHALIGPVVDIEPGWL